MNFYKLQTNIVVSKHWCDFVIEMNNFRSTPAEIYYIMRRRTNQQNVTELRATYAIFMTESIMDSGNDLRIISSGGIPKRCSPPVEVSGLLGATKTEP